MIWMIWGPEWRSGLRHFISVLEVSLQTLVWFQAVSQQENEALDSIMIWISLLHSVLWRTILPIYTYVIAFFQQGMVVGAMLIGLCWELQRCWGFQAQQFPVCIENGPPPKGHPAYFTQPWEALESTSASSPMECFRHLVESMPRQTEAVLRAEGGWSSILGMCS